MANNEPAISDNLEQNESRLKQAFQHCSDVEFRKLKHPKTKLSGILMYMKEVVDVNRLEDHLLQPFFESGNIEPENGQIALLWYSKAESIPAVEAAVNSGKAVLLLEGQKHAYVYAVPKVPERAVEQPPTEAVIRGPREGFTERVGVNVALIRLRIKSSALKCEVFTVGKRTKTKVALMYMEDIADSSVINTARKRIESIEIDGVLESGYIEEMIEDKAFSPFPQLQYTERPDSVSGQLLEGKFAVITDGTPFVLTGPITFWQMLRSPEDYYERYLFSTPLLWLRYLFLFIAIFLPAIYIATTTFHQEMMPTSLVLSIAAAREAIPFPVLIEALIMEISFEALREAGIRLPKTVGQTVSILGALVIGQAAVEAGIVSAPMVIVVSMTGIASFTIPRFNFAISIRLLRFPLMLFAGMFGLYGIIVATVIIAAHLCSLTSFGVPYMTGVAPLKLSDHKDIFIRAPWWKMRKRPSTSNGADPQRLGRNRFGAKKRGGGK
ncbi:spore germination protein [Paenibacillus turpanensis]|uniref:spore germination protein n=1 Tax=Paenibacillus turpanensis TaxID=2689078 RepID=UPI00140B30AD|nr:spore germination protein [Paenibacillus turpanensis]